MFISEKGSRTRAEGDEVTEKTVRVEKKEGDVFM